MNAVWLIIILTAVVALLCVLIYRRSKPRSVSSIITVITGGVCAVLIYYYIQQYGLTVKITLTVVIAAVLLILIWVFLRKALVCRAIAKHQKLQVIRLEGQDNPVLSLEGAKDRGDEDIRTAVPDRTGINLK